MFTLLGKVIARVCDKIFDPYEKEERLREDHVTSHPELTEESNYRSCLEGEPVVGQITHLNNLEQYGLINEEFYFELSMAGGEHLSVGTLVLFRQAANRVQDLSILPGPPPASTVAKVVGLANRGFHLLDDTRPAILQQGYEPEFEVCCGDWVRLHFDDTTGCVTAVEALRSKSLVGQVTRLTSAGGIIDQEIAFSAKLWPSDAPSLCVGLRIAVRAIESDQGSLSWRATSLEPCTEKAAEAPPSPSPCALAPAAMQNGAIGSKRAPIPRGLDVPTTINFGQMEPGKSHTLQLCITNGTAVPHVLLACKLSSSTKQVAHAKPFQPTLIASGDKHSLDLVCTASQVGLSHERIELEFEEGFVVHCVATVSVVDPLEKQLQVSNEPSSSVKRTSATRISNQVLWTVPGEQCPMRKGKLPVGLPHFPVNAKFWQLSHRELERFVSTPLRQPLQPSNYVEKLQLLLHLEEVQHTRELQEQTLCPALMRLEPQGMVHLDLTDWLGESRPPPRLGDRVVVQPANGGRGDDGAQVNYEGFVHRVMSEDALLRFSPTFNTALAANPLQMWELRFLLNRTPLRRCHLAVRLCKPLLHSVLFPRGRGAQESSRVREPLKLVNERLNELQQEAVKCILASHRSTVPFVVWGPPGTGKTVTLVEAILQVYLNLSHSRVLVCAPSNSAADLLTEKLWESGVLVPSDIVRLLGFQRDLDAVPARIRPLCVNTTKLERASHHRIVVSTIVTAGALYGLGLPADHFTHGFLDEAGQATEPECLVLAGLVCLAGGSLVLCGDPMQLGPVLRSRLAARGGLGESLLHRLLLGDASLPFTRLRDSYRCVQSLLEPYSTLFYDGQLRSCVEKLDRGALPGFPVLFHGVRGCALREGACPSWFNPSEAMQVTHYLQRAYGPWGLLPSEVGVLTPYRRQTLKLRSLIASLGLPACKIGSAEEFQGQERRLILVSTVRGSEALVAHGSGEPNQSLDFLFCARRFNVAISRASAMLVVVGNPDVLTLDKHWKSLMDYCAANNTYYGCRTDDMAAP